MDQLNFPLVTADNPAVVAMAKAAVEDPAKFALAVGQFHRDMFILASTDEDPMTEACYSMASQLFFLESGTKETWTSAADKGAR